MYAVLYSLCIPCYTYHNRARAPGRFPHSPTFNTSISWASQGTGWYAIGSLAFLWVIGWCWRQLLYWPFVYLPSEKVEFSVLWLLAYRSSLHVLDMSPCQMHALEISFPRLVLPPGFQSGFIGFSLDWFVSLLLERSPYFLYHYCHLLLFCRCYCLFWDRVWNCSLVWFWTGGYPPAAGSWVLGL